MIKKFMALAAALCLMTGCSGSETGFDRVSDFYSDLPAVTLEADITTTGGTVICYGILFTRTEEGDAVTILSPESLSGITARILPGKAEVTYDDVYVETLLPSIPGFVPADAVTGIIKDLGAGIPASCGTSEVEGQKALMFTFEDEQEGMTVEKTVWVGAEDLRMLKAEFFLDGTMIMQLDVRSFVV